MLTILIEFLFLFSINSKEYNLANILDASTRVKNYVITNKNIPKRVGVANDVLNIAQFTYVMGITIRNINDGKPKNLVTPIELTSPSSLHECNLKLTLSEYIDAINRVVKYCKEHGAAPAYVKSKSVEIGYREYLFGFSKILDFYRSNQRLPNYNVFDSSIFKNSDVNPGVISGVYFAKGINDKKTESDVSKYIKNYNKFCASTNIIVQKARELTKNLKTDLEKAKAIFYFVRDNIKYVKYNNSQRGASKTLTLLGGNCCDQTNLLVALCRASNIPIRYVHGLNCIFDSGTYGHVWAQILLNNIWYAADTTSIQNDLGFINNWKYNKYSFDGIFDLLSF